MKRNNKSIAKVLTAQFIFVAITLLIITLSLSVFKTAASLFVISDNIHFIEESGRWTEAAHKDYDEMIAARMAIKDESVIGHVLVTLGSNTITQLLRIIILVGLFALNCFGIYMCFSFIKWDIQYCYKKLKKNIQKYHR